jgi:dienelactone hydrolase
MTNSSLRLVPLAASVLAAALFAVPCAHSQEEIAPPQGKGHVVVFVSGIAGPKHDRALSEAIAALGYDVYVCDGRKIAKSPGGSLRAAIQDAQQSPHALPGKVALVGVSLGGGFSLALGSEWPDVVAVDIVWYPATGFAARLPGFARRISVPVLMFAGESDHFENCCLIETARAIEASAKANNAPFELVTYPGADHDFIKGGRNYNPGDYEDALNRTAARLKAAFAEQSSTPVGAGQSSDH